jgi:hypothetical protein
MCTILYDRENHICHIGKEQVLTKRMLAGEQKMSVELYWFLKFIERVNKEVV